MSVPRVVATHPRRDLLPTLRALLGSADEAVLATAFVDTRGIHLLGAELGVLTTQCRLVATSAFRGTAPMPLSRRRPSWGPGAGCSTLRAARSIPT